MDTTEPRGSDAEIVALLQACGMDEANLDDGVRNVRKIVEAKTMAARDTEPLDLDEIEARANAAFDGPWWHEEVDGDAPSTVWAEEDGDGGYDVILAKDVLGQPDAEFIAHAREDVPALIAEVRRLREEKTAHEEAGCYSW